ncbi:hypothetical protein Q4589_00220 [Cobetia marina]|uniref:hypothetical protein n=1 Tax=Cobetia marina TaxID=28258 RepID=UPI000865D3AD|nr:hypothetical protein [Cobetia marina]AOM00843.1 hypothetical protein BFX80_05475 [Cobetia marina]MDO6786004.1 hypothetical protein [Cobetia marina]
MGTTIIVLLIVQLYFLPWFAVIHAAYYKGVHVPAAAAVGIIGTPMLGFLYVIAMPADPVKLKRRRLRSAKATDKECPHCLSLIPKQASICHHCGRNSALTTSKPIDGAKSTTPPPPQPQTRVPAPMPAGSFDYAEHGGTDTQAAEAYKRRIENVDR